jgi:hypothetical protein
MACMEANKLQIYLNDHLAGAVLGIELAKRSRNKNAGSLLGEFLGSFLTEIRADQTALKNVIARAGLRQNPVKTSLAWLGEKAGRFKLNGEIRKYSDLSRLEEIEGLQLGVRGKLGLWIALGELYSSDARFKGVDFELLSERARRQLNQLETHRLSAARQAFLAAA